MQLLSTESGENQQREEESVGVETKCAIDVCFQFLDFKIICRNVQN
jgi:hypothetical protein